MNENGPHRFICLIAIPQLMELFGKDLGCGLVERGVALGQALRFQNTTFPVFLSVCL